MGNFGRSTVMNRRDLTPQNESSEGGNSGAPVRYVLHSNQDCKTVIQTFGSFLLAACKEKRHFSSSLYDD
jgi:hypothetical protein